MKLNAVKRLHAHMNDSDADALERELTTVQHSDPNVLVAPTLMVGNDTVDGSDPADFVNVPDPFVPQAQAIYPGENMTSDDAKIMIDEEIKPYLSSTTRKIRNLGTRDGLTMWSTLMHPPTFDSVRCVFVTDAKHQIVGALVLDARDAVTGVWLSRAYRGKAVGLAMYEAVLHVLGYVRSGLNIGIMAVRVWHRLSSSYEVRLINRDTRKPVNFEWGSNGIPVIDGKPMNKLRTFFYFEARK